MVDTDFGLEQSFGFASNKLEITRVCKRLEGLFIGHGYEKYEQPKVHEKNRILFLGVGKSYSLWIHPIFGVKVKVPCAPKDKVIARYGCTDTSEGYLEFQFGEEVFGEEQFIQALVKEVRLGARISASKFG
jgi:hypothetical protein